ncbi:hypothetical protein K9N68_32800 [Kovacikia minuta CCNUW1]|uniref:DUF6745 domain-containing protein n=1 Tax=Kovacikia minuta TaxID=2931930 RepID=UPI001CD025C4|nr:hypothetical protein [Kovacikia minuta]UBF26235.1 hypothetical protein K9N68_32800 [Kovacikia minuta CCNUW1]
MITELTPEQEALIPVYREKWRAIALSTERIDRQKVSEAVKAAYAVINEEEPEIVFCNSPFAAYSQLKDSLLDSLVNHFDEQLKEKQHIQLTEQVERTLWARLVIRLLGASGSLTWKLLEPLYSKLGSQIMDELEGQIFPSLAPDRWTSDACWFDYFITALSCQYLSEEWAIFQALTVECGWIFPFKGTCLVCDRPTKLCFDSDGRLHAEGEPAIQFADGFSVYAHHGALING